MIIYYYRYCLICGGTVVVITGPEDDQLSSKDSSDENCCDEDITVFFFTPPLASFSTDSDTDLVDSSDCTLLAFCSRCELAVSLVTCDQRKWTILKQKILLISIFKKYYFGKFQNHYDRQYFFIFFAYVYST